MLNRLKEKWGVSATRAFLILCTFAIGGSTCGWLGKKIMHQAGMDHGPLWIITYLFLVTLLWPICVMIISIPFGQFNFFKGYLGRMWARMTGKKPVTRHHD